MLVTYILTCHINYVNAHHFSNHLESLTKVDVTSKSEHVYSSKLSKSYGAKLKM